jgi:hypothetical protein
MSALERITDSGQTLHHVRKGPKGPIRFRLAISDPTARALPDEEAQFHSAEGRLKTLIPRQ